MALQLDSHKRLTRISFYVSAAAIAAVGGMPTAISDPAVAVIGDLDPNARESLQGVSVNDSPEARKDIETARGMERQKDWAKAASWYQDVLEKYRSRVVAYRSNQNNTISVYRGIIYQVQEALAKWPPEGIAAYRARYEGVATTMLQGAEADDYQTLDAVFKSYFITESGKQAGLKLIDLHLEAGDFAAAAWIGDRLLDWYPPAQLQIERAKLLYRTALAYHLHGDDARATARAAELKAKFPNATGSIFGKDSILTEALDRQLATKIPRGVELAADSYPMFCGSPDRSHISRATGRMGAKIASIELSRREPPATPQQIPNPQRLVDLEDQKGLSLGIMPAVDGDQLFFQDGSHIYAVNLQSGLPLPGWASSYPGDQQGRYTLKSVGSQRTQQLTVSVTDTAVLAVMGVSSRATLIAQQMGQEPDAQRGMEHGTRLICLDRTSGAERWKADLSTLDDPKLKDEDRERVRALDLSGSPLVVGDTVYAIARGGRDPQFENCYVVAFELATGKYKWSSLIASANSALSNPDDSNQPSSTLSHLAYSSGRVFVLTNLGAVAAVDAYSGTVVWLTIYPREGLENIGPVMRFNRRLPTGVATQQLKPWEFNPVMVQDGKLFVLPIDSKYLMVYDAGTGNEVKGINVADFANESGGFEAATRYERPTTLLAVTGDKAILGGRSEIINLNWKAYDSDKSLKTNLLDGGGWYHLIVSTQPQQNDREMIRGRAFVTADSIFVPTTDSLLRHARDREGRLVETYPANGRWDTDTQGPGNVLVTSEHVVLATANRVDIYTDMKLALAKLDAKVAAAPNEPEPRLEYAEVMFAAGQLDLSLAKMNEAIAMIGGPNAMLPGVTRQRIFADCRTFAQKLSRDKRPESNEYAVQFYDLTSVAAQSASDQVHYRLSRAQYLRENVEQPVPGSNQPGSLARAVGLYQEILSHPDWRVVATSAPDDGSGRLSTMQAGDIAERAIAKVIQLKPEAYASVAKEASAALDQAHASADPDRLLAVAQSYPNAANISATAMLQAAELYESAGNPRLATHVLRQIYRKYGAVEDQQKMPPIDRARVVEAMVRNYLTLPGGYEVATARLRQAVGKPLSLGDAPLSGVLVAPGGRKIEKVSFSEALAALELARPEAASQALPDFHILYRKPEGDPLSDPPPAAPAFTVSKDGKVANVIESVAALVLAPLELSRFARFDRIVTTSANNQLGIYGIGQSTPLAQNHDLTDAPRGLAWIQPGYSKAAALAGTSTQDAPARNHPHADLLLWSGKEVLLTDGDSGSTLWRSDLNKLRPIEVVATTGIQDLGGDDPVNLANVDNVQVPNGQLVLNGGMLVRGPNGQRVLVPRGQQVVLQNGVLRVVQPQPDQAPVLAGAAEDVEFVRPLGDRVLVATSTGRLLCLSGVDGKLIWQTRLTNRPFDKVLAGEDFTVVQVTENKSVLLLAIDNYDGQVQMKTRSYAIDSGNTPVNMALSADGILVWTMADRICGKDLYESATVPKFEYPDGRREGALNNNGGVPQFLGCNKPGQLQIVGNKILAVEQSGRRVTIRDIQTGALSKHMDKTSGNLVASDLSTKFEPNTNGDVDVNVTLRVVGNHMYLIGPRSVVAYNIDRPAEDSWTGWVEPSSPPNFQDAFASRDFLVVLGQPGPNRRAAVPNVPLYRLTVFSRMTSGEDHRENGLLVDYATIIDPTGFTQWQPVEGGFYFLTGAKRVQFLKGARL